MQKTEEKEDVKEKPRSSAPIATRPGQSQPPSSVSSDGEEAAAEAEAGGGKDSAQAQPEVTKEEEEEGGGSAAAAVGISVVVVVLVAAVAAFLVLRTRLAPRLRARLTRTPYEDIVIGRQARSGSQQNVIA